MRDGMPRRNTLTQCRMASASAGTVGDLFLAAEELALEAEGAAPKTFSVNSRREGEWSIATLCRRPEGKTTT